MNKTAYLIVICDRETNAILGTEIWSSPEWEASRCLPMPTYVAYTRTAGSFQEALSWMVEEMRNPMFRYHYLLPYLDIRTLKHAARSCESTAATTPAP